MSGGHGIGEQAKITQTGSTTERQLRAKVDDLISVKDFGAVGDGITDDTAAITAAIAYAGDFVNVYFPCPGTYKTTTWGTIPCGYQELVPATGAVPRPLGTKIQEILSAKDFGAKGDGVTNDTTAIGNLINAAVGTQLINLPCPGTYVTSTYGTLACGMYYPPLAGGVLRPVADKLLDTVSVTDYGAIGNGVHDDTAAFQAAITAALVSGSAVYIPGTAQSYIISSTIACGSNIRIFGDGKSSSLNPTISDASPVLNFPTGSGAFRLEDFTILHNMNTTNFLAGTVQAQQCTGIRVQSNAPTTYSARFSMSNIQCSGLKIGFDITGFIVTADNIVSTYNEIGFRGDSMNAVDLNLKLENNRQDFAITNSLAVLLRQPLTEGQNSLGVSSTIDSSSGVLVLAPYVEGSNRTLPWIAVGTSSQVIDFKLLCGNIATGNYAVYPISLDNVVGAEVNAYFQSGTHTRKVLTTANTVDFHLSGYDSNSNWFHDGSKQIGPALNYWPNRQFDLWFRGWNTVTLNNATKAQETTIVRKGPNALKVLATVGTSSNLVALSIAGPAVTALRSKTVRIGVWVWVPNITEYDESSRTALPSIILRSQNGAAATVDSTTHDTNAGRNAWNFMTASVAVQSDATLLIARLFANQSGTNASGNEYIVVDSITLVEDSVPVSRQMNDDLPDSPLIPGIGIGGLMVATGTAAPTDTLQTYVLGDTVINSNPNLISNVAWNCTTAGSPGTWTMWPPPRGKAILTYASGGNATPDATHVYFTLAIGDGGSFTINNSTTPTNGQSITFYVSNTGTMGTINLGTQYKCATNAATLFAGVGVTAPPANGFNRSVIFNWHDSLAKWVEVSRSVADTPN